MCSGNFGSQLSFHICITKLMHFIIFNCIHRISIHVSRTKVKFCNLFAIWRIQVNFDSGFAFAMPYSKPLARISAT